MSVVLASSDARAQDFPAPSNRNYTLDLYQGSAIGSARIVGMGGVAAATAQGSSGMLTNPAAAGVRPTTSSSTWDWDWHLETQSPGLGNDSDNNGSDDKDGSFQPNGTLGIVLQYKDWGVGITGLTQTIENRFPASSFETTVTTDASLAKFSLAHFLLDGQLVVGGGLRIVKLEINSSSTGPTAPQALLALTGAGMEAGVLWKPKRQSFRVGGSVSLAAIADETVVEDCNPLDCAGYVLPNKLKVPWVASIGIAGRRAHTPWNMTYEDDWRDEKALLWGADLVLTGKTHRGAGLEAFGDHQLQPSGRKYSLSVRAGVEYEWLPGELRIRGGSYFEPSRFKAASGKDIPGRLHLTLGLDWHFWSFEVWDYRYRAQVSTWADVAEKFGITGLSFGFWH